MRSVVCLRCQRTTPYYAHGLCKNCWEWAHYHNTLCDYPSVYRSRDDTLDDYVILRGAGLTRAQIAERFGIEHDSLVTALRRAARAGDPRSDWTPTVHECNGTHGSLRRRRERARRVVAS